MDQQLIIIDLKTPLLLISSTNTAVVSSLLEVTLPNKEEIDQLSRSNKKVKMEGGSGERPLEGIAVDDVREESTRKSSSYRDMVVDAENLISPALDLQARDNSKEDDMSDDDEDDGDEDDGDVNEAKYPTIKVYMEEKRRLRSRWKDALIIKLIDHTMGYTYLVRRLISLWHITARMNVIDVGSGAYVVRFANAAERERALYDGPWVIAYHYLAVTHWFHNFDLETYSVTRLVIWVRFPNMPMEYYDPVWLLGIGKKIGTPLRVDVSTASADRGRYARICVEIDLSKPLFSKFRLRKKVKRVEYEGINVICFGCGRYGHRKEHCQHGDNPETNQGVVVVAGDDTRIPDSEVTENYGKWMLAKKVVRRKGKPDGRLDSVLN